MADLQGRRIPRTIGESDGFDVQICMREMDPPAAPAAVVIISRTIGGYMRLILKIIRRSECAGRLCT